jgi:hypothetical protein
VADPAQRLDRPLHEARPVPLDPSMPIGSLPCDIDYLGRYAVVAALDGPDTIFPKDDLDLVYFKHVHSAVLREAGGTPAPRRGIRSPRAFTTNLPSLPDLA